LPKEQKHFDREFHELFKLCEFNPPGRISEISLICEISGSEPFWFPEIGISTSFQLACPGWVTGVRSDITYQLPFAGLHSLSEIDQSLQGWRQPEDH